MQDDPASGKDHSFDLGAYLRRIGLADKPDADSEGLAAIVAAHRLFIAFENLDIPLGRGISLDPHAVFDKLVVRGRGGYCFEQNQLFLRALLALGFAARPLLARVWLNGGTRASPPPLTHTLNLVTIDGEDWIADAGFGGSYTPPLPLADGAKAAAPDGATHRLDRDADHGWMLHRRGDLAYTDGRAEGEGFLPQYSFTLAPVFPADLALSNHWTSTSPQSRFVGSIIASRALPAGYASLLEYRYSRAEAGTRESGEIDSAALLRTTLAGLFNLPLSDAEAARLFEAADRR